jgi:hypothetical protein
MELSSMGYINIEENDEEEIKDIVPPIYDGKARDKEYEGMRQRLEEHINKQNNRTRRSLSYTNNLHKNIGNFR